MRAPFSRAWCAAARQKTAATARIYGACWPLRRARSCDPSSPARPAQPFLDPENARMFGSIRSVAVSAIAALEHVQAQRAAPFSVRDWVRARSHPGNVVHSLQGRTNRGAQVDDRDLDAARHIRGHERREDCDQRLWFVVDELDALGAIDGLKDALARLRKFGGRCVLGFQSIAQVSSTYGAGDAQTIVENCGNTLILRCSASENGGTSQFASRLIGEREILRKQVSRGSDREASLGYAAPGVPRTSANNTSPKRRSCPRRSSNCPILAAT